MKILILGSGGREHALAWKLGREAEVAEVHCAPGNPGMAACGRLVSLDPLEISQVVDYVRRAGIDLK